MLGVGWVRVGKGRRMGELGSIVQYVCVGLGWLLLRCDGQGGRGWEERITGGGRGEECATGLPRVSEKACTDFC